MFPAPKLSPIHLFDSRPRVAMPTRRCLHGRDSPGVGVVIAGIWAGFGRFTRYSQIAAIFTVHVLVISTVSR